MARGVSTYSRPCDCPAPVVPGIVLLSPGAAPGRRGRAPADRGSQYASGHYQALRARRGITCGMSRRAGCWDNAPLESFCAARKRELIHDADFTTRAPARAAIVEYIEVLSNTR